MPAAPSSASRLRRLLPLLVIVAGVTWFHWRGLRPGYTFLPVDLAKAILPWGDGSPRGLQNWLISDPLYQFYPFLSQSVVSLRQGEWLLWNPSILLGHPAAADPLFQTFYPGVLPFALLLGAGRGYAVALYIHTLLAALLMYGFMRSLSLSRAGGVLAAFTYALSGYMVTWFAFSFWLCTLAWLPGILWAYVLAVRTRSWRFVALGALCLGLALLAGQLQFVVVFLGFFAGGALLYTVLAARRRVVKPWSQPWPLLAALAIAGLGSALGAVQLLLLLDFLPLTTRTAGLGSGSLPLAQLIALLLPNFYGNPARSDYWGAGNFNESTIYVGVVALLLATAALLRLRRLAPAALTAGVAMLALLYFIAGGPGAALVQAAPGINQIPLSRFAFLLPLLVGWLAAVTLDDSSSGYSAVWAAAAVLLGLGALGAVRFWNAGTAANLHLLWEDAAVAAVLVAATLAALYVRSRWPQFRTAADWGIVALVWLNLFWFGGSYTPTGKVDALFPATPLTGYLAAQPSAGRVVALQRGPLLFGPNILALQGFDEPSGYSSLVPSRYHDLLAAGDPELDSQLATRASNHLLFSYPTARLLDMLGVGRMLAAEELFDPGPDAEFVHSGCPATTAPITAATPLAGSFTVWRSAINRLDLSFAPAADISVADAPAQGSLIFRLWRGAEGDGLFVETRLAVADILQSPQQVLYFAPQPDAPGQNYRWRIDAEGADGTALRLCAADDGSPALSLYGTQFQEVQREGDVRVYDRFTAFPRAAVVYAAETIAADADAIVRVLDPAFDLRNTVVSSVELGLPPVAARPAHPAQITTAANQRLVIHATAAAPAVLVLADQYDPGWQAQVDGVATPIVRVNTVLRGVPLAAGEHEIVFTFAPPLLRWGLALSLLSLTVVAALLLLPLRRKPFFLSGRVSE